jgi:hypothetical protein
MQRSAMANDPPSLRFGAINKFTEFTLFTFFSVRKGQANPLPGQAEA